MTPKEKAQQIYYNMYVSMDFVDYSYRQSSARKCALVAVNEYIKSGSGYVGASMRDSYIEYWQQVKKRNPNIQMKYLLITLLMITCSKRDKPERGSGVVVVAEDSVILVDTASRDRIND